MPLELTPEQNYVIVEINALPAYGSVALGVAEVGSEKGVLPGRLIKSVAYGSGGEMWRGDQGRGPAGPRYGQRGKGGIAAVWDAATDSVCVNFLRNGDVVFREPLSWQAAHLSVHLSLSGVDAECSVEGPLKFLLPEVSIDRGIELNP